MTLEVTLAVISVAATALVALLTGMLYLRHQQSLLREREMRRALIYARILDDPNAGDNAKRLAQANMPLPSADSPNDTLSVSIRTGWLDISSLLAAMAGIATALAAAMLG